MTQFAKRLLKTLESALSEDEHKDSDILKLLKELRRNVALDNAIERIATSKDGDDELTSEEFIKISLEVIFLRSLTENIDMDSILENIKKLHKELL